MYTSATHHWVGRGVTAVLCIWPNWKQIHSFHSFQWSWVRVVLPSVGKMLFWARAILLFLQYREWPLGKWARPHIGSVVSRGPPPPPPLPGRPGGPQIPQKSLQASCSPASILRTKSRLAGLLGVFTSFTACLICVTAKRSCLKLASMRVYQWAGFHDSLLQPDCLLADQDVFWHPLTCVMLMLKKKIRKKKISSWYFPLYLFTAESFDSQLRQHMCTDWCRVFSV